MLRKRMKCVYSRKLNTKQQQQQKKRERLEREFPHSYFKAEDRILWPQKLNKAHRRVKEIENNFRMFNVL
jgi:hypothetical protein